MPATVEEYIASLPEDRRTIMEKLRKLFKKNLPKGFEECISYGVIGYVVPHSFYPKGYHCDPKLPLPFIALASKKNFISIHYMGMYGDQAMTKWFQDEHKKASPKKLDMGAACIRYKKEEDIPFDLLATLAKKISPKQYVDRVESYLNRKK
ncbi:MAG: DUF1801 domain-containing protein [Chitinophagaceae bacterium]|nr:DUF1801 domain-containing protein [Chitinophagaceae bacterium]